MEQGFRSGSKSSFSCSAARADVDAGESRERYFLGAVVEQHEVKAVAGILRSDEMGQCERHPFGRGESILPVQNHTVTAIEHEDGCTRAAVFRLMDVKIIGVQVDGNAEALPAHRRE